MIIGTNGRVIYAHGLLTLEQFREILLEELDLRTVVGEDVRVPRVAADEVLVLGLGGVEAVERRRPS